MRLYQNLAISIPSGKEPPLQQRKNSKCLRKAVAEKGVYFLNSHHLLSRRSKTNAFTLLPLKVSIAFRTAPTKKVFDFER